MFVLSLATSLALLAPSVSATKDQKLREVLEPQDILSLTTPNVQGNATYSTAEGLPFRVVPTCAREKGHNNFILNLFNRANDACAEVIGTETWDCNGDKICCTNAVTNWCCYNTAGCGDGGETMCTTRVRTITSTYVITDYTTVYSTDVISVAGSTIWETIVDTSIAVVTESNVDTATDVTWVTVTEGAQKKARRQKTVISTEDPTPTTAEITAGNPTYSHRIQAPQNTPKITEAPKWELRGLRRRQTMNTSTKTVYTTSTYYNTVTEGVTSQDSYDVTSTTTSVYVSTITSAVDAKTTISVTSTITQKVARTQVQTEVVTTPGGTTTAPGDTTIVSPTNAGGGGGSSPGTVVQTVPTTIQKGAEETGAGGGGGNSNGGASLSKTAQIGIGAGAGAGGLVIIAIVAACLHRRNKNKKKETAELINNAVAAGRAEALSPPPADFKAPMVGVASSVPMPPTSPTPSQGRYSDLVPVYNSGASSPVPRYPSNPPMQQPYQYQYPQPPSPAHGVQEVYAPPQSPIEMHHPVPVEVPNAYSPRPVYPMPQGVPGQGPGYPGHQRYYSG